MNIQTVIQNISKDPQFNPKSCDGQTAQVLTTVTSSIVAKNALEIGTYLGYGTLHILLGLQNTGRIFTIDKTPVYQKYFKLLNQKDRKRLITIQGTSKSIHSYIKNKTFDLIFIDAGHSFEWVMHDIFHTFRHAKNGTVIIFHDALNPKAMGTYYCLKILKKINWLFFNRVLELVSFPTPVYENNETSGIGIIRITTKNPLLYNTFMFIISLYYHKKVPAHIQDSPI